MIKLYQFPISHFCEKARWALDYKKVDYQKVNLVPGLHLKVTKKLDVKSSVPILQSGNEIIGDSTKIIDYLDKEFTEQTLTPSDEMLRKEAEEWELFLDKNVGVNSRLCAYNILLNHPKIVKGFFTQDGPWYGSLFLSFAYNKLSSKMRYLMKINDETEQLARQQLHLAADKLSESYQSKEFLVGDTFTRADLSAASLFAPIMMPEGYGLNWPKDVPSEFLALKEEFEEKLSWLPRIYQSFR